MPDDADQGRNQPHLITVSFTFLVNADGEAANPEGLRKSLVFRLGYDDAEIPFSEKLFRALESEISEVLPRNLNLNRIGGELLLNDEMIKKF